MSGACESLLPEGVETSFADIETTMARLASGEGASAAVARSLATAATATVVAIGPPERLVDAAVALKPHAHAGRIRGILIAMGDRSTPAVRVTTGEIALEGLRIDFIDNAVAALRLPSLPALVWWRGGAPEKTQDLARLADRLLLDAEDPAPLWGRLEALARETPVSDLRWTALTRWRALMTHFFDIPGVAAAAERFTRLHVAGADLPTSRLFAGWLLASLKLSGVQTRVEGRAGDPIDQVIFGNGREELSLRKLPDTTCIEGVARLGARETSRIASAGDQGLETLIAEELRVRSRDTAFEAAVRAAGALT